MSKKYLKVFATASIAAVITLNTYLPTFASYKNYLLHTVKSGESLWKISVQYDITVDELMKANGLNNTLIMPGQQLKVPTSQSNQGTLIHTVQSGDVLWKIAQKYNVTTKQIVELNQLDPNAYLHIGQKLYIPQSSKGSNNDYFIHTVQSGDMAWTLSLKYGVPTQKILDANHLTEKSILYVGQKLIIPTSNNVPSEDRTKPYVTYIQHTVKQGDTPWNLSRQYGIPYSEIKKVNNFTDATQLTIGQKVTIPVHHVPITPTPGPQYGEYLDWWTQAQYVFPIGKKAKVIDFATGRSYNIVRSFGEFHADCEPLTAQDAKIMYEIWGNQWSWVPRAAIVEVDGRRIAASVTNMPHDVQQTITNNNFNGHFDMHFLNSRRHVDNTVNVEHQNEIKKAAGIR